MPDFIFISAFVVLFISAVAVLLAGLFRTSREPLPDAAWLQEFSADRYRPMLRLLADADYEFMRASGASAAAVRRLRSERRRIFKIYLRNLIRDFNRIHRAARILVLESEQESSEIAARLVRVRLEFSFAVFAVRCRLALHGLGIGAVDVGRLIQAIESVGTDFTVLAPARQALSRL